MSFMYRVTTGMAIILIIGLLLIAATDHIYKGDTHNSPVRSKIESIESEVRKVVNPSKLFTN